MKYAVVRIKGNQYKVSEGEVLSVSKTEGVPVVEVLLVVDNQKISVGKPVLSKAKVFLEVLVPIKKEKKITITTFKAKSRYRKKKGFRPLSTQVKIKSISA